MGNFLEGKLNGDGEMQYADGIIDGDGDDLPHTIADETAEQKWPMINTLANLKLGYGRPWYVLVVRRSHVYRGIFKITALWRRTLRV